MGRCYPHLNLEEKFYQHLPQHRLCRRPRGTRRHHGRHILDELAIAHRPEAVADRSQFGHWECDLVMFRKEFGKANVTSLVERVSRFTVVLKNPGSTACHPCQLKRDVASLLTAAQSSVRGSI